ncbi:uncharacterized protein P884DRAFT_198699 [Thermothelomyces heterothallicus CBS 202.75]|uniref:uncharacterized protein n=1 Tax=Thermothelomyces heterothallicus CBS 202.75 TaxID=1149848 RepID=UPI0037432A87
MTARPLLPRRTVARGRQPFSILQGLRAVARSFEPHPFQRLPVATNPAPADWGKLVRRSLGQAVVYLPVGLTLLGWPYAAKCILDGHM